MRKVFRMKPSIWPDYRCSSGKPSPGPFPDTALSCNSRAGPSLPFPIVLRATLLISALSRAEKRAMTVIWTCVSAILRPGSREMTRAAEPPRPVRPRFEPMPGNMAGPSLLQRPTRIVRDIWTRHHRLRRERPRLRSRHKAGAGESGSSSGAAAPAYCHEMEAVYNLLTWAPMLYKLPRIALPIAGAGENRIPFSLVSTLRTPRTGSICGPTLQLT